MLDSPSFAGGMDIVTPSPDAKASVVREALNMQVSRDGDLVTRPTPEQLIAVGALSICGFGGEIHVATADGWHAFDPASPTSTYRCIVSLSIHTAFYLTITDDLIVLASNAGIWQLQASTRLITRLDLPRPVPPIAVPYPTGYLTSGLYKLAVSEMVDGTEGPLSWVSEVFLSRGDTHGIEVRTTPGHKYRVYMSHPDGATLYYVGVSEGGLIVSELLETSFAAPCEYEDPLPVGSCMAYFGGCLWSAVGNVVYKSQPFRLGVTDSVKGFFQLPSRVKGLQAINDTLVVGTAGGTYVLEGYVLEDAKLSQVDDAPVVAGSLAMVPGSMLRPGYKDAVDGPYALWLTGRGHVVYSPSTGVKPITGQKLSLLTPRHGLTAVFSYGGTDYAATFCSAQAEYQPQCAVIKPGV